MSFGRQFAMPILVVGLLCSVSCNKKKPQLPPQAKAPADTIAIPLPGEISEATVPPPPPQPSPQPPPVEEPKPKVQAHRKRKTTQPPATTAGTAQSTPPPAATSSGNTTIASAKPPANPASEAAPDTAIAANVTTAELSQQKQTTAQLLDSTEKTISGLNRTLSHDEEDVVTQIRSYVAQSRKATTDGDFERAYNLATKAHLLSDALVKK
jgi:type IV secretory pathway VirB10-like protein